VRFVNVGKLCSAAETCDRPAFALGLCKKHDTMQRKYKRTKRVNEVYIPGQNKNQWYVHRRYGLSIEQYKELTRKPCQICGKSKYPRMIDHEHGTKGTYRGVLCNGCNAALGWFENWQQKIKEYLSAEDNCHRTR